MPASWLGAGLGDALRIAIRWAHAVATLVWVGGSLFFLVALRPALRATRADPKLEQTVAAYFREMVEASLVVLLVSGMVLTFDRLSSGAAGAWYLAVLALKVALALVMAWLTWELGWAGRRPLAARRSRPARRWLGGWLAPSRLIVVLGLMVVLLAIVLRHLFEAGLRAAAGQL